MSKNLHIFYVEDNEGDVELLNMCIERYSTLLFNITLDVVETIKEAKEKLEESTYDVVLVDWNLPDGEGIEIVEMIRTTNKAIPIFLLSGILTDKHREVGKAYNATACIEKEYSKHFIELLHNSISTC